MVSKGEEIYLNILNYIFAIDILVISYYINVYMYLQSPKYQEIVNICLGDGSIRRGQVMDIDGEKAVVHGIYSRLNLTLPPIQLAVQVRCSQ